ncbi:uncharacterized protein LOC125952235 [Anopheles darlingi]|uniref:uncharacterized protein LOC125952235 n=1 Tax=Anopheles darlingi TaxID=43151 RepID=UPI0021003729|nr:uncharacterized protein LOC125952235 [Anopheles darlingi]
MVVTLTSHHATSYIFTIATLGALVVATVLGAGVGAGGETQLSGSGTVSFTKLGAAVRNGTSTAAVAADRANRTSEVPAKVRPAYTRTELKVSRSLNPDNVQKLNVRSNNGRMVQIIVKKRTGMDTSTTPAAVPMVKTAPETRIAGQYRLSSADSAPESVDLVNAFLEHVNRVERPVRASFYDAEEHDGSMKNDRRPVRIKVSDEAVQETRVPPPVVISSDPVYMKDNNGGTTKAVKRGRSMQEIGPDGIPVVHGIRVPDDESDKRQVWRNARVINGELVPYEKGHVPTKLENGGDIYGQLIFAKPLPARGTQSAASGGGVRQRSIGPFTKADNFQPSESFKPGFGPFSVEDNLHTVGSIAINAEGPRVTGNIGPFSRADNSRPNSNARLVEYLRKINEEERRKHYPQIVSRANFKEDSIAALEQPKIQRRMLQNPGNPNYPVSQLYSINDAASNQEKELEDARKPVLQYAHPELGVQPAKPVPPVERKPTKAMKKIMNVQQQQQQQSPDYYNKAVHNDHSPYAIEPAMGSKDYYDPPQPQQLQHHHHQQQQQQPGPMMKMPRHPQPYENFKGPSTYPYNYGYIRRVKHEPPFWVKITDQMRDSLQNGISSVQEFTKPVLEPIVEAGQKISKNLGFVRKSDEPQDKVGVVVAPAANSIILPALGLMAGGAALGLGAVAVGRFFDMGLLRRSGADFFPIDLDELEHKRALEAIGQQEQEQEHGTEPRPYYTMLMNPHDAQTSNGRSKRAIEEHSLQDVERSSASSSRARFEQQLRQTNWKNPACAKRTFCQVMIQQGADDVVLMEKKMYTMLDMMHPALAATLTDHLSEVTDAIRQNDCSRFACQSPDHRRS